MMAHHMKKSIVAQRRREMKKDIRQRVATIRSKTVAENLGYEPNLLKERTVPQLRERAKALGLKGYTRLNKADLVDAIERKEGRQ